jgi:hypothetical protein
VTWDTWRNGVEHGYHGGARMVYGAPPFTFDDGEECKCVVCLYYGEAAVYCWHCQNTGGIDGCWTCGRRLWLEPGTYTEDVALGA